MRWRKASNEVLISKNVSFDSAPEFFASTVTSVGLCNLRDAPSQITHATPILVTDNMKQRPSALNKSNIKTI